MPSLLQAVEVTPFRGQPSAARLRDLREDLELQRAKQVAVTIQLTLGLWANLVGQREASLMCQRNNTIESSLN